MNNFLNFMKKAYENCWETFETRFSGFMRLFKIHECFYYVFINFLWMPQFHEKNDPTPKQLLWNFWNYIFWERPIFNFQFFKMTI